MDKLTPVEYKSQRIVTTKFLAEQYGTDEKNIQMNFSNNQKRFKEGKHYFKLEGQGLKDFKNSLPNDIGEPLKFAPVLFLWTDRGAARHAKILDTDEAWDIYEQLEETYFRVQENKPKCIEDVLIESLEEIKQTRIAVEKAKADADEAKRIAKEASKNNEIVNHRINNLDCTNIQGTPRQRLNSIVKKYSFDKGITVPTAWREFRKSFNTAYHTNIEQRKTNYLAKNKIKSLSFPEYLEKVGLIEDSLRVADKMLNA